ncbi:unnamed protein product [Rotaria sordida]|uniref:RING-type domain-containing protein n=1 Tax=Rotaria sordida TaxID=392033 RepID=A0A815H4E6_9BILA|nr:unnamed protein product [Rotaria sordida]
MDAQNKNIFYPKFICFVCLFILHDPVQFNTCGHRLCQSCFDTLKDNVIKCPQCGIETQRDQIRPDRGYKNDMQSLSIVCSHCNWTDVFNNYQLGDAQRTSNEMDTDILRTTTVLDDDFALNQLDEFPEAISMFANSIETLNKDVQCLNTELLEYQNKLQHLKENASNVKLAIEAECVSYEAVM